MLLVLDPDDSELALLIEEYELRLDSELRLDFELLLDRELRLDSELLLDRELRLLLLLDRERLDSLLRLLLEREERELELELGQQQR